MKIELRVQFTRMKVSIVPEASLLLNTCRKLYDYEYLLEWIDFAQMEVYAAECSAMELLLQLGICHGRQV